MLSGIGLSLSSCFWRWIPSSLSKRGSKTAFDIGKDVATTKTQDEIQKALSRFDEDQKRLQKYLEESKERNFLTYIQMNREKMQEILHRSYSLANAQELIDLAEVITAGGKKIAHTLRSRLSRKYPSVLSVSYEIEEIAKYFLWPINPESVMPIPYGK